MSETEALQQFLEDRLTSYLGSTTPRDYRRKLFGQRGLKNVDLTAFTDVLTQMQRMKTMPDLAVNDVGVLTNNAKTSANMISQWITGKTSTPEKLHTLIHFYRSFADDFETMLDPAAQPYSPSLADTFLRHQLAAYIGKSSYRDICRGVYCELRDLETAHHVAKHSLSIVRHGLTNTQLTNEDVKNISTEARLAADQLDALCQSSFGQERDMTKCLTLCRFYRHLATECEGWCTRDTSEGDARR